MVDSFRVALLIMGLSLLADTLYTAYLTHTSAQYWIAADCEITTTTAKELYREYMVGRSGRTRRDYYYRPKMTCVYSIQDASLSVNPPSFTYTLLLKDEFPGHTGKARAEDWLNAHYPKGEAIPIYYNPKNPQHVVQQTEGFSWGRLLLYGGVSVTLFLGGSVMLAALFIPKDSEYQA
jgi:hypothetical protein